MIGPALVEGPGRKWPASVLEPEVVEAEGYLALGKTLFAGEK
jgi:hypothetical protein